MSQELATIREQMDYAQAIAQANVIPDAYRGKPADILVAMGLGYSMGLSPTESLYRINVIKGKPTASAELIAAQVRKAGHKLRITKDAQNMSVTASIVRADDPEFTFTATRDHAWAKSMGLDMRDNYTQQPLTMLTWRAITAVAREACPEALYGTAYTPDEMHDMDKVNTPRYDVNTPPTIHQKPPKMTTPPPAQQPQQAEPQATTQSGQPATPQEETKTVHARPATKKSQQEVTAIFRENGVNSQQVAGAALSLLTGRTVATVPELTEREAKSIIEDDGASFRIRQLVEQSQTQAASQKTQFTSQKNEPLQQMTDEVIQGEIVE